jgi:hypothetical protein
MDNFEKEEKKREKNRSIIQKTDGWTLEKVRNRIFMKSVFEGKGLAEAGKSIGITEHGARWKWKSDKSFREDLKAQLVNLGLDDAGIAMKIVELLESRQHGLTKDGDVVDMGPDAHAQVKAMDQLLKVTGAYPDPRLDVSVQAQTIVYMRPDDSLVAGGDLFGEIIDVTPTVLELEPSLPQDTEEQSP